MLPMPKRCRKHGEKRHISAEQQEKQIHKMIVGHYPDQLKFPLALWDRQAVQQLIKLLFGYEMPTRTVGEHLSRWGYTPQKPIRKAYGNLVRGYAPAGKTPELRLNARKEYVLMISAVNNRGMLLFMLYDDAMSTQPLIEFMKRLVKDAGRKVILILDNLRVRHSKPSRRGSTKTKKASMPLPNP